MSSQAQIDANRLNAQKSTGPRTPEGRAAVRLNGVTHGLTASTLVLAGESESDFRALFDSLEAEHHPSTPTEELLVSQLAMASWRLRRLYHMEAGFLCVRLIDLEDTIKAKYHELDPGDRQAIVADRDAQGPNTLANLSRLEARIERSFYRALHELQRLRAQRPAEVEKPEKEVETPEKKAEKPKLGSVCKIEPKAPLTPAVPTQTTQSQPPPSPIRKAPVINITNERL
jgi:hypothetical protein